VSVARERDAVIRHRLVALDNTVGPDIGMFGASDLIALAR
jgi:hypothetical protein